MRCAPGKSTYLQQVALIVILAHAGCYVPASRASIRLFDRVLTRVRLEPLRVRPPFHLTLGSFRCDCSHQLGTADSLESNLSTFMVEMREMGTIVKQATPRSLVLLDELCRGYVSRV